MIYREFWIEQIKQAWAQRPVIWLSGVRRTGKTTLCKMLNGIQYFNCDLPSVQRQLTDPEFFFSNLPGGTLLVLDEIHRLPDPSLTLKIAADEYPHLRIIATGSSTMEATKKFRDSLTGRKTRLFFPPVLWSECRDDFHIRDLDKRLLHGGLPEFLLAKTTHPEQYAEWMESFYARDIQDLYNVRNRAGFNQLLQLLFLQSGGLLDITSLSRESGMSRPTVMNHLEALTTAHAISLIPPFSGGGRKEIVKQPKVYAFDTGFVAFVRGWNEIRESDRGILWEHLVSDMLRVKFRTVYFWRNKNKQEIDFVVKGEGKQVHIFECKINPEKYDAGTVQQFREFYPEGKNFCMAPHIQSPYKLLLSNLEVEFRAVID